MQHYVAFNACLKIFIIKFKSLSYRQNNQLSMYSAIFQNSFLMMLFNNVSDIFKILNF